MAKILIVDDRSFIRQFLLTLLSYGGHDLIEAVNGEVALATAKAERPDLVITDILMPVMDGFEFVRRLRLDPNIAATPVIFYTATYREPQAKALAESCGVRTVLPKPCEPQIILAAVDRELGLTSPIPEDLISVVPPNTHMHELKRLDGRLASYADELHAIKSSLDGVLGRLSGISYERRQMMDLSAKFSESLKGMQRLSSRLTSIIEITLDASPERGPAYIVEAFFDAAIKIIGARYAAVGIVDKTSRKLEHVFAKGVDARIFLDGDSSLLRSLMMQHTTSRLDNAGERLQGLPAKHPPVGAFLACSVASRDWVHGWLYFANDPADGDFTDEDERIAATIGAEVAIFYENAALYDLLQRHAAQLQVEIARREKAENETRARERQLAQAQKVEAIGQLTGGIAHDFNNLLTVIRANAEDLCDDLVKVPSQQRQAELILQAADRGAGLVRQLLAYARKQELHPQVFNVNTLFEPFVQLLRRTLQENIVIKVKTAEGLPSVNVDKGSLENVLLNLSINARDAMPHGGTIVFETDRVTLSAADLVGDQSAARPGDYVLVSVTDTGTGMSSDVMERAFEPFFTTKEVGKGTGLGLSMVFGFATQSGGHARIVSKLGAGTTVKIFLPAVYDAASQAPVQRPAKSAAAAQKTNGSILLVEDDDLVRQSVMNKLGRLGFAVTATASASEAIAVLEKDATFDLVFTDVILPGEMTGAGLARVVQSRWPGVRILATSGYTETTMLGKINLPSGVRLLSKPYSNKDLSQTLSEVMARVHE
ncbi:MAG: response regulator [Rhodospirillaceae bacterium]|nr:response regulator [Rhodospirillaceae bacterium]